jgi:NADPH-dependent 2,4-dienoyl-CoA reductase/sulfur reductase-like enzyme
VRKLRDGQGVRPCILCNQVCQVRDARNPIVSCAVDPASGYEPTEPEPVPGTAQDGRDVLVIGAGPAGLECARVAAARGHRVTVVDDREVPGGMVPIAAAALGRERLGAITRWLADECARLGVRFSRGRATAADISAFAGDVVLCTGSRPGRRTYDVADGGVVVSADAALASLPDGRVVVWDPVGGPVGVSVAETLRAAGREVALVTPDLIAGNELSRTGDLAPANVRLLAAGVEIERRSLLRCVTAGSAVVEDRFTGAQRTIAAAVVVDAGYRLPDDDLWRATGRDRAGDAVAPRTIYEAVLEGRRAASAL